MQQAMDTDKIDFHLVDTDGMSMLKSKIILGNSNTFFALPQLVKMRSNFF